jgi:hypothetical protein
MTSQKPQTPATRDSRNRLRFEIGDVEVLAYPKGILSGLGLRRRNRAKRVLNLSEGGVLLVADRHLDIGTPVHVRLKFPRLDEVIEGPAEVRWCREWPAHPGSHLVGVEFSAPSLELWAMIRHMRGWFTSRQYKLRSRTRPREAAPQAGKSAPPPGRSRA